MIRRGFAGAVFAVLALVSTVAVADGSVKQGARDARSGSAAVLVGDDAAPRGDAGFLTVTTDPAAKLEIDGADTGKTTPVPPVESTRVFVDDSPAFLPASRPKTPGATRDRVDELSDRLDRVLKELEELRRDKAPARAQ